MKTILITGASEGIGLATARLLATQSNMLTLVARNEEKLKEAIKTLPGDGHTYIAADLSQIEGVVKVSEYLKAFHPDVLINNAGIGVFGRFEQLSFSEQQKMINLNINALTSLAHDFLSQAEKGDVLVNMASVLGLSSVPGGAVYAGTKAYVALFSESLWFENKSRGVYVLGFNPGATRTNFHKTAGITGRAFPGILTQETHQVARELVNAIDRRSKPRVVSGAMSRLVQFGNRMLSRKTTINILGSLSPALRPQDPGPQAHYTNK